MRNPFTFRFALCLLLLLALALAGFVRAQDATPEATARPTIEGTPELTPEAAIEMTPEAKPAFPGPGSFTVRVPVNGVERRYRVTIPESYELRTEPAPLVIVLHGAGGTGQNIETVTQFNHIALAQGAVVIYPDGLNNVWNDGRPADPRIDISQDDVAFLTGAVDFLLGSLDIDPKRVYATGYSMGGMLSYRLACDAPDTFAAVASVASTFPQYLAGSCVGTPAVPLLVIQGTDDPVVPWAGIAGGYFSERDTLRYWTLHNKCTTDQGVSLLDDADTSDGTRVIVEGFTGCTNSADVQIDTIFHGGHTWPGHPMNVSFDLGLTSMDMDATQVIWDFFQAHPHA